jgi:DNA gyrase subunit A
VTDVPATTGYGEPVQSLFKFGDGERVLISLLLSAGPGAEEDKAPEKPADTGKAKRAGQGDLFGGGGKGEVIELVEEARPFLVVSAAGYGFRAAPELGVTTRAGRRFARVADGDELIAVTSPDGPEVLCLARSGKGLRFPIDEATELSGVGRGVILMKLDDKDRVVGAIAPPPKTKLFVAIEGAGDRAVSRDDFPKAHRAGKGHKVVKRGTPAGLRAE